MEESIAALETLGRAILSCREIPSPVFDERCEGISTRDLDFRIQPAPDFDWDSEASPDTSHHYKRMYYGKLEVHPEKYTFAMICLFKGGLGHPFKAYWYQRTNIGCVGDGIYAGRCDKITEIDRFLEGLCVKRTVLEIGRNEHYAPCIAESERGIAAIVGKAPALMKVVPAIELDLDIGLEAIPLQDIAEMTRRFGLVAGIAANRDDPALPPL
jgi:hypothetical protein